MALQKRQLMGASFSTDFTGIGDGGSSMFVGGTTNVLEEERRLIEKVFQIVDKDQVGSIDAKKLAGMFRLFGVESSFVKAAIEKVMENCDADLDGLITRKEFYNVLSMKFEADDKREDMQECFLKMASKNQKSLTVDDLFEVAQGLGEVDMDRSEIRFMISNLLNVHKRRMQREEAEGGLVIADNKQKGKGDESFIGKICDKMVAQEKVYFIRSDDLKRKQKSSKDAGAIRGDVNVDMKNMGIFKTGDTVKFSLDRSGNGVNLKEPELDFEAFLSVMQEEL